MSLQTRLGAFITAVGADIKTLKSYVLPATSSATEPAEGEKISWKRQADGSVVAELRAKTNIDASGTPGKTGLIELLARSKQGGDAGFKRSQINLSAADENGTLADLYIQNAPYLLGAGNPKRRAVIGMTSDDGSQWLERTLLGSDGSGDIPTPNQKAALVGERNAQPSWNYGIDGYHPLPSVRNRYLTEANQRVLWWDIPASGGGTVDFWPSDGYWLVKAFYGFQYDSNLVATAMIACARSTFDGATRQLSIRDQWTPSSNVSCTFSIVNQSTVNGVIRATSSHGNCRIIAQDIRGQNQV